jgi:hypothetical protein
MAYVFKDVSLKINTVDLSIYVKQVTINMGAEPQDASSVAATTALGLLNTRIFLPGLRTWSMEVDFLQDFTAAKVDATLYAAIIGGAAVAVVFKPTAADRGANNPEYSGTMFAESYNAVSGNVGEVAVVKVSLKPASALARSVAVP